METINLAFCIDENYVRQAGVALVSLLQNNPVAHFQVFVFSSGLSEKGQNKLLKLKRRFKNVSIRFVTVDETAVDNFDLTIDYISKETFFRYFIPDLLPNVDKILYLDADVMVRGDITPLWRTDVSDYYLAGCADRFIEKGNYKTEIGLKPEETYINAGVLLMNLSAMRRAGIGARLVAVTEELRGKIKYQDQDALNIVCRGKIKVCDIIYNFAMANFHSHKKMAPKAVIVHFTGSKKPWLKGKVRLKSQWQKYAKIADDLMNRKIRVGLLIDEFFGGAGTAYGGYGFLARKYIAKYLPDEDIQVDVLLGRCKNWFFSKKFHEDDVDLYRLPKKRFFGERWLKRKQYDIYLSIELTTDWVLKHETNPQKRLILWIQDPRPKSAWENIINTMTSIKDPCFFAPHVYQTVHDWASADRVKFISQGTTLNPLALELYDLPQETPIQCVPNPIEQDMDFRLDVAHKKKQVVFLGRLEAQKRCWLFCEVAKRMPEYEFYVIGQFFRHKDENQKMLAPYMQGDIPNLHFVGHADGAQKKQLLQESRILLSTAIWEGIPISWLEALSYGTVLVSALEREGLVAKFGCYVGEILGDGFDGVDKFIPAIRTLMENDELYLKKAQAAIDYVREYHTVKRFQKDIKAVVMEEFQK